jgi:hypothetical protein
VRDGLIRFVQIIVMLTKVPVPQFSQVIDQSLFDRLSILVSAVERLNTDLPFSFIAPNPDFVVSN